MRFLYVTTIGLTFIFFKSTIKELIDAGHKVDIACNEDEFMVDDCYKSWGCKIHHISCTRSPLSKGSLKAVKELKKIVQQGGYDIVHCHTPVASVCTRVACRGQRKKGLKVFYTAHGFHFYQGASKKSWLTFYPIERLCSFWTDTLITINHEDFERAKKRLHAKRVEYIPGVGLDVEKFSRVTVDRAEKRRELGVPEDALMLISVGELNQNKNHEIVIRVLAQMDRPDIHYVIAGEGNIKEYLSRLAEESGIGSNVHLLGYRTDVPELYHSADINILPSIREGLPVSLMEAMACRLPCIASRIRGCVDLIDEEGGSTFSPLDPDECSAALNSVINRDFASMGDYNFKKIEGFSTQVVNRKLRSLYFEKG